MALVAYGSSGESDCEETLPYLGSAAASEEKLCLTDVNRQGKSSVGKKYDSERTSSLFNSLPTPKSSTKSGIEGFSCGEDNLASKNVNKKEVQSRLFDIDANDNGREPMLTDLFMTLPPPKQNTLDILNKDFQISQDPLQSIANLDKKICSLTPSKDNLKSDPSGKSELDCSDEQNAEAGQSKSKKKQSHVKITIPSLNEFLEDDEEPALKKRKPMSFSTGLVSMLPEPRNKSLKEASRLLVPHVLSKKKDRMQDTTVLPKSFPRNTKSVSTQQNKLVSYSNEDSDEDEIEDDVSSSDFFSLEKKSVPDIYKNTISHTHSEKQPLVNAVTSSFPPPTLQTFMSEDKNRVGERKGTESNKSFYQYLAENANYITPENIEQNDSSCIKDIFNPGISTFNKQEMNAEGTKGNNDVPLSFRTGWSPKSKPQIESPQDMSSLVSCSSSSTALYPEAAYQVPHSDVGSDNMLMDEGLLRLQGKKRQGKEEIQLIDINADEQLPDSTEWLTKSITEEIVHRPSRKKHDLPTQQQRRKHQITYLAFQAKERELELKNQWSHNKMTRRQTQSKYGF